MYIVYKVILAQSGRYNHENSGFTTRMPHFAFPRTHSLRLCGIAVAFRPYAKLRDVMECHLIHRPEVYGNPIARGEQNKKSECAVLFTERQPHIQMPSNVSCASVYTLYTRCSRV